MNVSRVITMFLLAVPLCLLLNTWTCSANPGLSVQISKEAFDYASRLSTEKLQELMQNAKIPDMSKDGKLKYSISNINVDTFSGLNNQVSLIPSNKLQLAISVDYLQISLNWRYAKKLLFFWVRDHGSATLRFKDTHLSVNVAISKTATGGLDLKATSCSSNTDMKIQTSNIILKIVLYFFKRTIRNKVEEKMCEKAMESINNKLAPKVSNYPVIIPFAKDYIFDYSFESDPVISSSYMKIYPKAAVYYKNRQNTIPFIPKPLPSISSNNRMITMIISNYVLDTWLYAAYQKRIMKFTVTAENLPDNRILQTSCPDVCLGNIFKEIGVHFPNKMLSIEISASGRPQTVFRPGHIQLQIPLQFLVTVETSNLKKINVLTVNLGLTTEASVKLKDNKFFFGITNVTAKTGAFNSQYVQSYDTAKFQNGINPLFAGIAAIFNSYGPNGLPLVKPSDAFLSNPLVRIVKDAIIVEADLEIASL